MRTLGVPDLSLAFISYSKALTYLLLTMDWSCFHEERERKKKSPPEYPFQQRASFHREPAACRNTLSSTHTKLLATGVYSILHANTKYSYSWPVTVKILHPLTSHQPRATHKFQLPVLKADTHTVYTSEPAANTVLIADIIVNASQFKSQTNR